MSKGNCVLVILACIYLLISIQYKCFSDTLFQILKTFKLKMINTSQLFWILMTFIIKQPMFDFG